MFSVNPTRSITELRAGNMRVEDRLTGKTFLVKVSRGRFVGRCNCGYQPEPPWFDCRHQAAVRTFLLDRW